MITEVAKLEFDNTSFIKNVKESIDTLKQLGETDEAVKAAMQGISKSLSSVSAAKPIAEMLELKEALKNVALPGQSLQGLEKIFTGAAGDVNRLKQLLRELKGELKNSTESKDYDNLSAAIKSTEKAIKSFDAATKETSKSSTTLKQDYRTALNQLQIDLKATGGVWTSELINKAKELGNTKDDIGDLQNIINNFSSDSFKIDASVQGIQTAIGAMQVYTGVLELAGLNTEDYQKSIAKMTALQGVASGVQQIYNALQKDSALVLGLTSIKTNLASAAQAAYTAVVGVSTGALKTFKIALASTGVGLLVIGLGYLVSKMIELSEASAGASEHQKRLNEVQKEANEKSGEQIAKFKIFYQTVTSGTLTIEQQKDAVFYYNKEYGKSLGIVKSFTELQNKLIASGPDYIKYLQTKARAEAAGVLALKSAQKELEIESSPVGLSFFESVEYGWRDKKKVIAEKNYALLAAAKKETNDFLNIQQKEFLNAQKQAEKLKLITIPATPDVEEGVVKEGVVKEGIKKIENIYKTELRKLNDRISNLQKSDEPITNIEIIKNAYKDKLKGELDAIDDALKGRLLTKPQAIDLGKLSKKAIDLEEIKEIKEFNEKKVELQKNIQDKIYNLELDANKKRIDLIADEFEKGKAQIEIDAKERERGLLEERNKTIDDLKKGSNGIKLSGADLADALTKIDEAYNKLLDLGKVNDLQKQTELAISKLEKLAKEKEAIFNAGQTGVDIGEDMSQTALNIQFNNGKLSRKAFEDGSENIRKSAAKQRMENELREAKAVLSELEKITNKDNKETESKKIAARKRVSAAERAITNIDIDKEKEKDFNDLDKYEKIDFIAKVYDDVAKSVINSLSNINAAEADNINKSIAIQEKRVNAATKIAERGNAEYLQLEEDRLQELKVKQEENARRQLTIDGALQTSQILVAVAGAAAQIVKGGTVGVITGITSIIAAIASGVALVNSLKSAQPKFYDGTEYLHRGNNPHGRDTVPAMLHEGERVVPSYVNRHLFGVMNKDLPLLVRRGMEAPKINTKAINEAINISHSFELNNTKTNKELKDVKDLLKQFLYNQTHTIVSATADPNAIIKLNIEHSKKQYLKNNA